MLKSPKFKELEYPLLINIAADDEEILSFNSNNFKMKIYKKINGKMVEFLNVTGESDDDGSRINVGRRIK